MLLDPDNSGERKIGLTVQQLSYRHAVAAKYCHLGLLLFLLVLSEQ